MQTLASQSPGGQLTTSTFGTPYIIQQLRSNPQITRELLTDIGVTLKTPLPSPADFVKNLDKQFQASRKEQSFVGGSSSSFAAKDGQSRAVTGTRASSPDSAQAAQGAFSDLEDLLDASHKLVEESVDSRARSQQASPAVTRDILRQTADNGAQSGRFTRDQPGDCLWRTSSSVTADGFLGTDPFGAAAFEIQAFSGIQDLQQEAGVPLVMATAPGPHAQLLHNMCQRRYWDTLDIRQYLTRIDKPPRLRLEPSQGARFPGKARALADSIQAWTDMQEANAQTFSNKLEASFLHGGRHALKASSPISIDNRRMSSESFVTPASSPTRSATKTSSTNRAVLVAR
ncbi:hypothetical protein WJX77_006208 [Trebouxia sp. C0004]